MNELLNNEKVDKLLASDEEDDQEKGDHGHDQQNKTTDPPGSKLPPVHPMTTCTSTENLKKRRKNSSEDETEVPDLSNVSLYVFLRDVRDSIRDHESSQDRRYKEYLACKEITDKKFDDLTTAVVRCCEGFGSFNTQVGNLSQVMTEVLEEARKTEVSDSEELKGMFEDLSKNQDIMINKVEKKLPLWDTETLNKTLENLNKKQEMMLQRVEESMMDKFEKKISEITNSTSSKPSSGSSEVSPAAPRSRTPPLRDSLPKLIQFMEGKEEEETQFTKNPTEIRRLVKSLEINLGDMDILETLEKDSRNARNEKEEVYKKFKKIKSKNRDPRVSDAIQAFEMEYLNFATTGKKRILRWLLEAIASNNLSESGKKKNMQ